VAESSRTVFTLGAEKRCEILDNRKSKSFKGTQTGKKSNQPSSRERKDYKKEF